MVSAFEPDGGDESTVTHPGRASRPSGRAAARGHVGGRPPNPPGAGVPAALLPSEMAIIMTIAMSDGDTTYIPRCLDLEGLLARRSVLLFGD